MYTDQYIFFVAIILPSINEFLNQVVTDKTNQSFYLGFALSAFSLTGLISSPIYGRITDKTNSVKLTIVISNLFEIAGLLTFFKQ